MSLWDRLYRAKRDRRRALPRWRPDMSFPTSASPPDDAPVLSAELSPDVEEAIERVLDRELPTFRANRAAALARDRMLRLTSNPPPLSASVGAALPYRRGQAHAAAERRMAQAPPHPEVSCDICGGPVRIDHLDLDSGAATYECLDCGRHWTDPATEPAAPAPDLRSAPDGRSSR